MHQKIKNEHLTYSKLKLINICEIQLTKVLTTKIVPK